jgi:hypothetical protein
LACFSFYPTKNLGICGEGGAVVTSNPAYERRIRLLRDWGTGRKYEHVPQGYNYRLEPIQAAILRVKLRRLEVWIEARRSHAAFYDEILAPKGIRTSRRLPDARHVYHLYTIRAAGRDELQAALRREGVQTAVPVNCSRRGPDWAVPLATFPQPEAAAQEVAPGLSRTDLRSGDLHGLHCSAPRGTRPACRINRAPVPSTCPANQPFQYPAAWQFRPCK